MPDLTLITGGPGSGKTTTVVETLAAVYGDDPFASALVLVPTVRHGDQFRRRLVARCSVTLGLRVSTISRFSRGIVSDASVPSQALADELLTRTLRVQVEAGPASYFKPIAGTRGLHSMVRGAIGDLFAEVTAPEAMSEAANQTGSDSLVALASVYAAYISELEQRGWVHPSQIPLSAARLLRTGNAASSTIVVDGFHLFRGTELALLQALAREADIAITLDSGASARSLHDYERLLRLFPQATMLRLAQDGRDAPLYGTARGSPAQPAQLRLFSQSEDQDFEADVGPPAQDVIPGEAADREGQMRAIARQIKQRLTRQPSLRPSDFAVAFRQASPYLRLARQVFAEYDLPLDPAAGERLNSRPLGVWLRRLLHLAEDGWKARDVVAVLSSGFVDLARWNLRQEDIGRFAQYSRENHLWSGEDALGRAVEGLRLESEKEGTADWLRDAMQRTSNGMAAALATLRELLERPTASTADHARSLEEALFGQQALLRAASRGTPGVDVEMDAFRSYLRDLEATHEALGGEPEEFASFRARIEAKLDAPTVILREAGGVLLAPMHTLHGLRFNFVAVGGLIAGEFPAPRTSAGLLNNSSIRQLNQAGLNLPPEPRLTEDELWISASTRADSTMAVWKTRLDERGRPAAPSHYFPTDTLGQITEHRLILPESTGSRRELAIACTQDWANRGRRRPQGETSWPVVHLATRTEAHRRSFSHAGLREGRLTAGLVDRLTDSTATWSASRIESYRTCAFQFFGQYGLRLRELDQELEGVDPATQGTVIHDILQDALGPLIESGQPLTTRTLEAARERLHANGRNIWNEAPVKHGFGRAALWRLEYANTLRQLELLLQREAGRSEDLGVTRILGAEQEMSAELPLDPPLRVNGRIDRIDEGDDFVVIVDYKSGRGIRENDMLRGRRVQLQLYGHLGRIETNSEKVIARYAWVRPDISQWELDSSEAKYAEAMENVLTVVQDVRDAVQSGDFRVNPQESSCPTYCSMKHVCRVNQFSRWKHWESRPSG